MGTMMMTRVQINDNNEKLFLEVGGRWAPRWLRQNSKKVKWVAAKPDSSTFVKAEKKTAILKPIFSSHDELVISTKIGLWSHNLWDANCKPPSANFSQHQRLVQESEIAKRNALINAIFKSCILFKAEDMMHLISFWKWNCKWKVSCKTCS